MKLLIIGHARHGKDTLAEMLLDNFGYTFESSSVAAARIFLFEALKEKYHYGSFVECFEDRINRRKEWHDLICEYNKQDKARLAKEILKTSEVYVGMRSNDEVETCLEQKLFGYVIGIFDPRKPLESKDSFDIDLWSKSDFIIPNAGTLEDLNNKVLKLRKLLK